VTINPLIITCQVTYSVTVIFPPIVTCISTNAAAVQFEPTVDRLNVYMFKGARSVVHFGR